MRIGARSGLAAAAAIAVAAGQAAATWSILLVDTRTGEIALGSATCLTGFDLQANTPVLLTGVGGCTAQSFVDSSGQNRAYIRDQIALGVDPDEILDLLAVFDSGHQTRQYGFVDVQGRAATFSGTGASQWKGGQIGSVGDIVYAIQGNILTGEPVVTEAVRAVIDTPGDLAEKMMAAMEAARRMGGDGRCSCSGSPTSCGSPPASFEKSAHIAYMLIARTGDMDGCTGLYRAAGRPLTNATGDFDNDGKIDIAAVAADSSDVSLLFNQTPDCAPVSIFEQYVTTPAGAPGREIVAADVTGDGALDLIVANDAIDQITILAGDGAGAFGAPRPIPVGDNPRRIVVDDLDGAFGPDIAVANFTSNDVTVLLDDGAGGYTRSDVPAGGGIDDLVSCDVDRDGDVDLVYIAADVDQLAILRNTGGAFAVDGFIPVPGGPTALRAADFDRNGEIDFAVATVDNADMAVVLQKGGVFETTIYPLSGRSGELAIGQFSGDDNLDIAVTVVVATADLEILEGAGDGTFSLAQSALLRLNPNRPEPADLTGDGWTDLAIPARRTLTVATVDSQGGVFASGQGCAIGDYWMTFNVPNQQSGDPDPVFTLRDMFDTWRTDLVGRPDAVQSIWKIETDVVPGTGGRTVAMKFALNDWQSSPITEPVQPPVVRHAKKSAGLSEIGPVVQTSPTTYELQLTSGVGAGLDIFDIVIDDGVRPVTLMPAPTLLHTCYADCDGSGDLNFFDFLCYQNLFAAGDPDADCDGDGTLTFFDFLCFQNAFAAGCP
ncbi:MAG: DUF1028 domain-containing protein [Phycisphaerales bacterium JB039]